MRMIDINTIFAIFYSYLQNHAEVRILDVDSTIFLRLLGTLATLCYKQAS